MSDLVKLLLTAGVSIPAGYFLHMLTGDRQHRAAAWKAWNGVNQVTRTQDSSAETLQFALGEAEWALHYGHVPRALHEALAAGAVGYWAYWRVFPHGWPAPDEVYAVHQQTVDELRLILLHPFKNRLRRRPDYTKHLERVNRSFEEMWAKLAALAARLDMAPEAIDTSTGRVTFAFAQEVMRLSAERSHGSESDGRN